MWGDKDITPRSADIPSISCELLNKCEQTFPAYMFYEYRKDRKQVWTKCTRCGAVDYRDVSSFGADKPKHNAATECTACWSTATYKQVDKPRGKMKSKKNFSICLARTDALYIRCVTIVQTFPSDTQETDAQYDISDFCLYRIRPGEALKYNLRSTWKEEKIRWRWLRASKNCTEPNFKPGGYCINYDNSYTWIDDELYKSPMRYALPQEYVEDMDFPIRYLCEAAKHPQLEYLLKLGKTRIVSELTHDGGADFRLFKCKENDIRKFLRLTSAEIEALDNFSSYDYLAYLSFLKAFGKELSRDKLYKLYHFCAWNERTVDNLKAIREKTGISLVRILNYQKKHYDIGIWADYIEQCERLGYNLDDEGVTMPKNLARAHERATAIINDIEDKKEALTFSEMATERAEFLAPVAAVRHDLGLCVIIPRGYDEIIREGRILSHCVGGYAKRHCEGQTNILFLRQESHPDYPWYTIEVDEQGRIIQCYGYKNNNTWSGGVPKPPSVIEFVDWYQQYLAEHWSECGKDKKRNEVKSA